MIITDFLHMLDYQFYDLEQNLYNILGSQINSAHPTIFIVLIVSGLLTSINPCLISIIPISVSYIYSEKLTNKNKHIFLLGILTSTIASLLLFELLRKQYEYISHIFPVLSYMTIIIISLNLLQILELNTNLLTINKLLKQLSLTPSLNNYITGLIIGVSSSTCTAPILLIILLWVSSCKSWVLGIAYMCTYLFSYIFPIYLIINSSYNYQQIKKWPIIWNNITLFSGCIMLGYSVFAFLNILLT
uniref:Cytochrome c biogenesis protein transmembrane region n=1 Tax=Agarophyton chilense TaxID=2510777 RepID=A0A141SES4_AGACH|nr:cytochrome c biogenesis protein transmembrane region [Agarophyton chilense]AMK96792.1 cytochrome c biogenesis protein transmembrane region [Agarophyton chilense]ASP44687.1 thiol:disulfide interchange protein [Agarophyton chilense]UAD84278.1 thiol:disulfide interchange protein [Agarophyton chilense]